MISADGTLKHFDPKKSVTTVTGSLKWHKEIEDAEKSVSLGGCSSTPPMILKDVKYMTG